MNDRDVELLLAAVPRPRVAPGAHRSALKAELLELAARRRVRAAARGRRWATAACCTLLLAACGWAAQRAYWRCFVVEQGQEEVQVMPDGSVYTTSTVVGVTTNDPTITQQDVDQQWRAMKLAISRGDYVLLDVTRTASDEASYCYQILLEDGASVSFCTQHPLP